MYKFCFHYYRKGHNQFSYQTISLLFIVCHLNYLLRAKKRKTTRNYCCLPNMILKKRRMRKMKTECNWILKKIATNCYSDNYLCLMKKRMKV